MRALAASALDIHTHGAVGIADGLLVELLDGASEERGERLAGFGAREMGDPAVGVLHQHQLKSGVASAHRGAGSLQEEQLLQHDRRGWPAGGSDHGGVAQLEAEHWGGIDTRIGHVTMHILRRGRAVCPDWWRLEKCALRWSSSLTGSCRASVLGRRREML